MTVNELGRSFQPAVVRSTLKGLQPEGLPESSDNEIGVGTKQAHRPKKEVYVNRGFGLQPLQG
jgi:hypothetical protein